MEVKELLEVRKSLASVLQPEFVKEADKNKDIINKVVADNIDYKKPEDGEVVLRMVQLAKERNIQYQPNQESCTACHAYCLRKGIPPPEGLGGIDGPPPVYVPGPAPQPVNFIQPPNPPPGGMPAAGMGGAPPGQPSMMPM